MATTLFSTLIDGETVSPFDPNVDVLQFDDDTISANSVQLAYASDGTGVSFTVAGKTVFLPAGVLVSSLTTVNITFANGSLLIVGDNNVLTANDEFANTLTGTAQGDYLTGLGGADTMQGGQGSDTYVIDNINDVINETTFINNDIIAASTTDDGVLDFGFSFDASLSADGNLVLFTSNASNLVAGDENFADDIFIKDLQTGTVQLVSADANGVQGNSLSAAAEFSADNDQVVFESIADNLVAGDDNFSWDIFVKDTQTGTIQRVSTAADDTQANSDSANASFSDDGRFVVFESNATNLVAGDNNGNGDIFIKDLQTGAIQRVSIAAAGTEGDGLSTKASLSADGRYVVFESDASNLVADDTNASRDIFVKDLQTGTIQRVSTNAAGAEGDNTSANASFSGNARYVVFDSFASNLLGNDTNNTSEIFIKDLLTGAVQRVSTNAADVPGNGSSSNAILSSDSRFVVFESTDSNLIAVDDNFSYDIFVKDLQTGVIVRVSTDANGAQTINDIPEEGDGVLDGISDDVSDSLRASFSADGRYIVFESIATNLVTGDVNASSDVFRVLNPFFSGNDTDTVLSSISYTLPDDVENLTLTGIDDINGTGNDLNNLLVGNGAVNTLNGLAGNDIINGLGGGDLLMGGAGNDEYVVDSTLDVVTELAGGGTDRVWSSATNYTLSANVENLTLTGAANINGMGNILANTITGNSGNNILDGWTGNDTMVGGAGNDEYVVDSTLDVVTELAGGGTDRVWSGASYALSANVENLTLTGVANINGMGNILANTITGNSGNNILDGWTGNDIMAGGAGNDEYVVDSTLDVVTELAGGGTDRVWSGASYALSANVENLTLTGSAAINGTGNTLNNIITGNSGANTLTGGAGNDLFVFNTTPGALNVDTITDFVSGQDRIALSASVFTAFAGQVGNTVGLSANLTYNSGTGVLAYDADGAGAGAAVDVAVIGSPTHPATLGNDFLIVA